jgi:hypothetical protein
MIRNADCLMRFNIPAPCSVEPDSIVEGVLSSILLVMEEKQGSLEPGPLMDSCLMELTLRKDVAKNVNFF